MRIFLMVLFVILMLIPIVMAIYLLFYNAFYHKYFSRKGEFLKSTHKNFETFLKENNLNFKNDGVKELKITSDGVNLYGQFASRQRDKLAILSHTFGTDHRQMVSVAQMFETEGYDVLSLDLRGHGKSQGQCSFGAEESSDLLLWIDKLLSINPNYKIVLFGIGLGASSQLLVFSKLPPNVKLVVCESAFDSSKKELSYLISKSKIKPIKKAFFRYLKRTKELQLKSVLSEEELRKTQIPLVLMHDEKDEIVPIEMAYSLQELLPVYNKNLCILNEAKHGRGCDSQPYQFKTFISKSLRKYGL